MDCPCSATHAGNGLPDRRRGAASHPAGSRLQRRWTDMGAQCVRPGVRRLAAARRPAGRHDRAGPRLSDWANHIRRRLAYRRPCSASRGFDRGAGGAGRWRRTGRAQRPGAGDGDGAQPSGNGAWTLALYRSVIDRRICRADPRWGTHRFPVLALGAADQRAGRRSGGDSDRPSRH